MPSTYRYTDGYRWYSEGNERPSGLVSYEVDEQGRVIIAAGEVWCRVAFDWREVPSDDPNGTPKREAILCHDAHRWSSLGALKKHIKEAHELEVAPSAAGGLSSADDQKTSRFYNGLHRLSKGMKVNLVTPRKARAIMEDRELHNSPLHGDGTTAVAKLGQ
ncbi:hypothetical protein LX32DRAFT_637479 [Colletotrichum zoysiae]|uniref:Uncharacterized protein n=1 Tax=Colletotrichum zoysiae TaxID=1216348 RepID=A0AAD9M422_9PEZI|nr:hypothetical protein LX32DRAFT_637479 [Colletotrichum zoysiae]